MEGKFVVKSKDGTFNAVSPDMKLEQTIQRSKKSPGGIIGQTRQDSYISEWELVYHEILAISNNYHDLTSAELSFRETDLHHELGGNVNKMLHSCVQKAVSFIDTRGNPFELTHASKLHHFTTGQCVPDQEAERLLNLFSAWKRRLHRISHRTFY